VRIAAVDAGPGTGEKGRGEVHDVLFEGDRVVYEVRVPTLDGAVVRVIDRAPERHRLLERGRAVCLDWDDTDLLIFAV
jgi:putative spermidine/putrescine transport system ATP-binding protein